MPIPLSQLPSLKAKKVRALLRGIGYRQVRRDGSHVRLTCPGRPDITFAFHDKDTVSPRVLRKMLQDDIGLTDEEILKAVLK